MMKYGTIIWSPQYITSQKFIENESTKNYQINLIMVYTIHHTATSYHNSPVTLNLPSINTIDIRVIWLQWMKSNANEYWHPCRGYSRIAILRGTVKFWGWNSYWYIFITYCWVTYFWGYKILRIVQNFRIFHEQGWRNTKQ